MAGSAQGGRDEDRMSLVGLVGSKLAWVFLGVGGSFLLHESTGRYQVGVGGEE